jgi:hypothetical protein
MEQGDLFADLLEIYEPPPPATAEPELEPVGPVWTPQDTSILGDLTGRLVVLSSLYRSGLAAEFRDHPVLLCLEGPGCRPHNPDGAIYGRQWDASKKQEVTAWAPREAVDRLAGPEDLAGHPCFDMESKRTLPRETWGR